VYNPDLANEFSNLMRNAVNSTKISGGTFVVQNVVTNSLHFCSYQSPFSRIFKLFPFVFSFFM